MSDYTHISDIVPQFAHNIISAASTELHLWPDYQKRIFWDACLIAQRPEGERVWRYVGQTADETTLWETVFEPAEKIRVYWGTVQVVSADGVPYMTKERVIERWTVEGA